MKTNLTLNKGQSGLFSKEARLSWLVLNVRVTFPFLLEGNPVLATTQGQLKYSHTQASVVSACLILEYPPKIFPKMLRSWPIVLELLTNFKASRGRAETWVRPLSNFMNVSFSF